MLRLVLGPEDDVASRWQALQPVDLNELDPGTFSLLPLLHARLAAAGIDDPLSERIAGTFRSTWYRSRIALRRLAGLHDELAAAGVEPLVIGGASVSSRFYPQVGLRPLPQLDVAVAPEASGPARRIVEGTADWVSRLERADYVRFEDGERFVVVLHSGLPSYAVGTRRGPTALRAVLARASTAVVDSATIRVLSPADELVLTCGLGARSISPPSIQWLLDAAAVARSGALDPAAVVASAEELALVAATSATMRYLSEVGAGAEVGAVARALDATRPGRRETLAYRLGARGDALSQGLAAYLRGTAGEPLTRTLREVPRDLRRVDAAGWARKARSAARR